MPLDTSRRKTLEWINNRYIYGKIVRTSSVSASGQTDRPTNSADILILHL
jgi:hypothetical protein